MNIPIISRQQLEIINRKTLRYPLQVAEKDYFLALVMQIISQSALGNTLVFKAGTAAHHCYLDQYRFSEDLDFSSSRSDLMPEDLTRVFADVGFLSVKKLFSSEATIKINRLQYAGPLTLPNSLKVEVDYKQNVLLPPQSLQYHNVWGLDFKVRVMDVREISTEKIRAMSDRARYRDFYDLYLLSEAHGVNLDEVARYISQKEIRKPISKASIRRNWQIVGSQKIAEMNQIFYSKQIADEQIKDLVEGLPFEEIITTGSHD